MQFIYYLVLCVVKLVVFQNCYPVEQHILQKYLRAESHRKALAWQKRYLMVSLRGHQDLERQTATALGRLHLAAPTPTPEHRFRYC